MTASETLVRYHLLGRTGLRVSPLALGTMTFGPSAFGSQDWGADEDTSRSIFRRYLESGGNFVDTANIYTGGRSEELLGAFIREAGSRDRLVLATKYAGPTQPGDPNAVGDGRKNLLASLDASLRRLQTDYVDLYWMHVWDTLTPAEEVMATFDAVVRSGKARAVGLSDVPAWYAAKAQVLAWARGWEPVAALQLEYSLMERSIEREHVPAALDLGLGVVPWSPLANGFLTGKYRRGRQGVTGAGRLQALEHTPVAREHTDRDWAVLDALLAVAEAVGRSPAQVALNWVTRRPGVVSTLIGARSVAQLEENLAALDFGLPAEHVARLDEVGRPELGHPYALFDAALIRRLGTPGFAVSREPRWFRG
jgi:aryl-alcohol dehydrogenase-like predicted oxidoreductase